MELQTSGMLIGIALAIVAIWAQILTAQSTPTNHGIRLILTHGMAAVSSLVLAWVAYVLLFPAGSRFLVPPKPTSIIPVEPLIPNHSNGLKEEAETVVREAVSVEHRVFKQPESYETEHIQQSFLPGSSAESDVKLAAKRLIEKGIRYSQNSSFKMMVIGVEERPGLVRVRTRQEWDVPLIGAEISGRSRYKSFVAHYDLVEHNGRLKVMYTNEPYVHHRLLRRNPPAMPIASMAKSANCPHCTGKLKAACEHCNRQANTEIPTDDALDGIPCIF